ncbi:MAG TPA: hypothetical protein VHO46_14280 [Bacteroidales bacterium]|nr:hypothetical protein [Bacteroidales bacterium]
MDFKSTIDLIIRELDEARDIMEDLKKTPGISVLEVELAISKCRNAAEVIALLKHMKEKPDSGEKTEIAGTVQKKNESQFQHAEVKNETTSSEPHSKQPSGKIKNQAGQESTLEIIPEQEIHDPGKPDIEHSSQKPFVAPIIADTFSHLANRFNEQIGEKQADDFSYTHGRKYTSISDAIGINDRFFYVREVFNGNNSDYNEAILKLENALNLDEAKKIIQEYRREKQDNEAVTQLLDLVKRKLASHE